MLHTLVLTIFLMGKAAFITEVSFPNKQECEKAKATATLEVPMTDIHPYITGVSAECKNTPQT